MEDTPAFQTTNSGQRIQAKEIRPVQDPIALAYDKLASGSDDPEALATLQAILNRDVTSAPIPTGADVAAWLRDGPQSQLAIEAIRSLLAGDTGGLPAAVTDWANQPKSKRRWLVKNWIPAGRVGMLIGRGGAGKSQLMLQFAANLAGASPAWLATQSGASVLAVADDACGPIEFLSYEDEPGEAVRRLRDLNIDLHALGDCLRYRYIAGLGPLWGPASPFSPAALTTLGQEALAAADDAALLIIDPLSAAYGGSEIDRPAVRAFMSTLDAWAASTGCAVLIVAHPNKESLKSKDEEPTFSGSTDWEGASRFMLTLRKATTGHILKVSKSNYAKYPWELIELSRGAGKWIAAYDKTGDQDSDL